MTGSILDSHVTLFHSARGWLGAGLLGAMAVGIAGCAVNPVSGRPEVVLVSTAQEQRLGDEEAKQVEQEMGLLDDPTLTSYLETIGQRLAKQSPRQDVAYTFRIVDTVEPNAFALPGGHVYVSRGLLALANSEDELAGTVGHEIGHVAARHSVKTMTRQAPFAFITNLTAGVTGLVSPTLGRAIGGIGDAATGLVVSPFNRQQERQADRVGQDIAARAGWDPAGLSTFLNRLEREDELRQKGHRKTSFFDTHPATPERVKDTAAYAEELQRAAGQPTNESRPSFLARLDGLVVGPRAANGILTGQVYLHPDLNFRVRFPEQWHIENSRRQVAAASQDGQEAILLDMAGSGEDPLDGARALEKAAKAPVMQHTERLMVGGLRAARTRLKTDSSQGTLLLNLVWIAHAGKIYQLAGICHVKRSEAFDLVFERLLRSFRPLTLSEHAGVRESRLRLVKASQGETLDALAARSHSSWSAEQVAVANGLARDAKLAAGELIKIVVTEPYAGER
ncbi:MAG: M48 family metalloprotease [Desulfomonile tiedjei]|nr:M48 family metalloprotease [Desulfomonile tiedjei]